MKKLNNNKKTSNNWRNKPLNLYNANVCSASNSQTSGTWSTANKSVHGSWNSTTSNISVEKSKKTPWGSRNVWLMGMSGRWGIPWSNCCPVGMISRQAFSIGDSGIGWEWLFENWFCFICFVKCYLILATEVCLLSFIYQ